MTGSDKSDPRKIHIGPTNNHGKGDNNNNVVQLPTEVHKIEPTKLFQRIEVPIENPIEQEPSNRGNREKVRAAVKKCQTAFGRSRMHSGTRAAVEPETPQHNERHTISADILRHRQIREKCYTIREVTITVLTIIAAVNIVVFMLWLQFLLYTWSHP